MSSDPADLIREALGPQHITFASTTLTWAVRLRAHTALDALVAERDRLGNELAQERARPGGTYDQAAYEQACAESESLRAALTEAHKHLWRWINAPDSELDQRDIMDAAAIIGAALLGEADPQ